MKRYRVQFHRAGFIYKKQYAASIQQARGIVWEKMAMEGHYREAPTFAAIEATEDTAMPGRKPRWQRAETWDKYRNEARNDNDKQ